ncbi:MAG: hypothetical protein P8184_19410 [Calditrichia bacterium]
MFGLFAILFTFLSVVDLLGGEVRSAWAGLVISFFNSIAGAAILSWGIEKPDKEFYGAFFGGMIVRFALIFLALYVLIKVFSFNETVLVISLVVTYFFYLGLEIWIVNKYAAVRGKGA